MRRLFLGLFLIIGMTAGGNVAAADGWSLPGFGIGGGPAKSSLLPGPTEPATEPKPLEKVLQSIDQRLPGRALGARLVERDGQRAYEIRWMGDNGRVHDIIADAMSGKILDRR